MKMYKYITIILISLFITSCEKPPSEEIRYIDDHVYIWKTGFKGYYEHDARCPKCQKLKQEQKKNENK